MLPVSSILMSGCDTKNYNLTDFYSTYKSIGNNASNLTLVEADKLYQSDNNCYKIDIDYSKSSKLSNLVEDNSTAYYHLKYFYQRLLNDSLAPMYFFGESIANNKKISNKQTKQLFTNLNELKQEYEDIDFYLGILTSSLQSTDNETINSLHLKKVFSQYEQAITKANNLSVVVCDVYYNTVLSNSNYNYSSKQYTQLTEADLIRISLDVKSRVYYYQSIYANIYNQLYVKGNDYSERLILNPNLALPNYTPYTYIKTLSSLTTKPTTSLVGSQKSIYNYTVSLYNIQNNFDIAYNNFNHATSNITYSNLNVSSSTNELNYGNVANQFANGIAIDSCEILNNLIELLYL